MSRRIEKLKRADMRILPKGLGTDIYRICGIPQQAGVRRTALDQLDLPVAVCKSSSINNPSIGIDNYILSAYHGRATGKVGPK